MYKEKTTIYRCDHCGKHYHNYSSCYNHEEKCLYNPELKACGSCIFKEHGFRACGLTGNTLDTKKPITNCENHKTIEEHEDEIQESKR